MFLGTLRKGLGAAEREMANVSVFTGPFVFRARGKQTETPPLVTAIPITMASAILRFNHAVGKNISRTINVVDVWCRINRLEPYF